MTVKELKEYLSEMPNECHVYINQEHSGMCILLKGVDYSDTLGGQEDDSDMTDGVVLSSIEPAINIGEVKDGDTIHIDTETGTVTKTTGLTVSEGLIDQNDIDKAFDGIPENKLDKPLELKTR